MTHQKVSFNNRLGINLVADLYVPKNLDRSQESIPPSWLAVRMVAVKEQSAGLYAQTMAERGFVTLAHDASYNGESGGQPHFIASSEALVEDFSAAVDFLGTKPLWTVNASASSASAAVAALVWLPRKPTRASRPSPRSACMTSGRRTRQGLAENVRHRRDQEVRGAYRGSALGRSGWRGADDGHRDAAKPHRESSEIDKEFYDYYRTPRGQHPRSSTAILAHRRRAR